MEQEQQGVLVEIPDAAVEWANSVPWRKVKEESQDDKPAGDPHWYVIRQWREIDTGDFFEFARTIRALGYPGEYIRPYNPRPLRNHYLEIGEHVYWCIWPNQMCRTLLKWKQHTPLPRQETLID